MDVPRSPLIFFMAVRSSHVQHGYHRFIRRIIWLGKAVFVVCPRLFHRAFLGLVGNAVKQNVSISANPSQISACQVSKYPRRLLFSDPAFVLICIQHLADGMGQICI